MRCTARRPSVALGSLSLGRPTSFHVISTPYVKGRATRADKEGDRRGKGTKGKCGHIGRSTPPKTTQDIETQGAKGRATFFGKGRSPSGFSRPGRSNLPRLAAVETAQIRTRIDPCGGSIPSNNYAGY